MISLCPACGTEQLVTAIALQKNRGVVPCEQCVQAFKPRAHRVMPARERAFKRRQQAQQQATTSPAAETAVAPVANNSAQSDLSSQSGGAMPGKGDSANANVPVRGAGQATNRDTVESSARAARASNPLAYSKSLQKTSCENAAQHPKAATISPEQKIPAPPAQTVTSRSTQEDMKTVMQEIKSDSPVVADNANNAVNTRANSEGVAMSGINEASGKQTDSATQHTQQMQQQRMRRMRQAMAREKMLLDYEKLKIENEKLEMEKKKLELERVKLEIMRKHNMLESKRVDPFASKGPALDGRPTVELVREPVVDYDSKTGIFPRTPSAIDHGKPAIKKREKVRLELLPNEPQQLVRKNLAVKKRTTKSK